MNRIQPLGAHVAYMTCPGNHGLLACVKTGHYLPRHITEIPHNFSHYLNRFTMPADDHPFWYSWDMGPIHFIRSLQ